MKLLPLFCSICSADSGSVFTGGEHTISTSSSLPSSSSTSSSIQTFPSLPTLHPFYQNAPPPISSSTLISTLTTSNYQTALAFANYQNTPLLFTATSTSLTIFSPENTPKFSLPKIPLAGSVKSIAVSGRIFFTAHQDSKIRAWKLNHSGKIRLISSLPTVLDRIVRFPIPSSHVAVRRHRHRLWIEHVDAVSALAVSGSGLLFSVSWDKTLKIWRISDLKCVQTLKAHDDAVNSVTVSRDGVVYTGSADTRVRVWSRTGSKNYRYGLVATLEKHKSAVNAVAVDESGSVLYSGSNDRSILVWEREESASYMTVIGVLRGHEHAIMALSTVGSDGLVSGSTDRTVRIWRRGQDGGGYNCLCVLVGHMRGVRSVTAVEEEEGYRICSGSSDGEIRVWSVQVSSFVTSSYSE